MSKFNTTSQGIKTQNLAKGHAYKQTPELELLSILLTSFAGDDFYRTAGGTLDRLKELTLVCDKKFVAQAAIYARTRFGMRSITHMIASELAPYASGQPWAHSFYKQIIYRPDDMMEILSYHYGRGQKPSQAMKAGFALAFDHFDRYALAKYRGEGKGIKLVDVANLVHPRGNKNNAEALRDLVKGTLRSFDTWETELSKPGADKARVWKDLLVSRKLGYFALLRNLRNIIEQAPDMEHEAISMLTDENLIRKSLVLPFRYIVALDELKKLNDGRIVRNFMMALNRAVDISLGNVPVFLGDTLVVLDVSGSMHESHVMKNKSPHIIGALFASVLIKASNADFMVFSDHARYMNVNPMDSTLTIAGSIRFAQGGTNFPAIFQQANKKYDRVIILSDMQGWIEQAALPQVFSNWKKATGSNPYLYSFDLKNYGTTQFPEQNVFCLAGFSEKVFDIMSMMEGGKSMTDTVREIEL